LNRIHSVTIGLSLFGLCSLITLADSKEIASTTTNHSSALLSLNESYRKTVKPIFQKKCFDCHSRYTHQPWYYQLPGVKQLIDHDVREAREDLDMSEDFPFLGKGTPTDYLDVLQDVIKDGSMPPWRYRILHRDSKLTNEDRVLIQEWIEKGQKDLK
jgi:uncharacterized membrane protein